MYMSMSYTCSRIFHHIYNIYDTLYIAYIIGNREYCVECRSVKCDNLIIV